MRNWHRVRRVLRSLSSIGTTCSARRWLHALKFAHAVALNHCRLLFGPYTHWCINLDVDEYLFNSGSKPLASYLGQMRKPHVYLPSYIVPMTVDNSPRRCFDSPFRTASATFERRKYIYRVAGTALAEVHYVVPRKGWIWRSIRTVAKPVLRVFGVDPGRFLAAVRRVRRMAAWATPRPPGRPGQSDANGNDEPTLFFFHFRALNTGWKYPRRVVPIHPDGRVRDERIGAMRVIRDERIAAMRVIVDSRHRQPDQDAVPHPALSGDHGHERGHRHGSGPHP